MNLKRIRHQKGISQTDIAKSLGISRQFISDIENGKNEMSLKRAIEIANFLNVSLDELVGRKSKK